MADTIEKIREHVLWNVNYQLGELTRKVSYYAQMQGASGSLGVKQALASFILAQLRPKVLWWNEIKTAIESEEPDRAMSALERLIRHYRPSKFFLTWIAPLCTSYWEMGMGPIATGVVSANIREATVLLGHFSQKNE